MLLKRMELPRVTTRQAVHQTFAYARGVCHQTVRYPAALAYGSSMLPVLNEGDPKAVQMKTWRFLETLGLATRCWSAL
jgi:hypothetical protein